MCKKCDPKPYCLWCGEGTARVLPVQDGSTLQGPVYCTLLCAARSALYSDQHAGVQWCVSCQQWHDDASPCGSCDPIRFCLAGKGVTR